MKILPRATIFLIAANVAIYLLQLYWGGGNVVIPLDAMGAMHGDAVRSGEWWRLVSSAFLHLAIWHVAANCYVLYLLGSFLELILGGARFLALYALSALGGGLAVLFFARNAGLTAGASGAVWGLLVAYLVLAYRPGEALNEEFARRMRRTGWINLALNLAISFVPGVSMSGHLGGGIAGGLLALSGALTRGLAREREFPEAGIPVVHSAPGWRLLAGLAVLLMAGCVAAAIVHGRPWELRRPPAHARIKAPCAALSVELPVSLKPAAPAPGGGACSQAFGTPGRDPIVVEFERSYLPGGATGGAADQQAIKTGLERETLPEGATRTGAVEIASVNGMPLVRQSLKFQNDVVVRQWVIAHGDDLVTLTVAVSPELPDAWSGEPEKIINSLHPLS